MKYPTLILGLLLAFAPSSHSEPNNGVVLKTPTEEDLKNEIKHPSLGVCVAENGDYSIEGEPFSEGQLIALLKTVHKLKPTTIPFLIFDRHVDYKKSKRFQEMATQLGFSGLKMNSKSTRK